jgi:hypothetical protein
MTMTHTLSRALGAEQQRRTTHRTQFLIRGLGRQLFNTISQQLKAAGLKLSLGTIVDASIVSAPSWMHRKDLS